MSEWEPKIVAFLCNWCSYAGADGAGGQKREYPAEVKLIRVMCSGRVDPQFVLRAFEKGADGVLILACHPGDCHYKEGNLRALQRYRLLLRLIGQFGIPEERCRFDYVSASEGEAKLLQVKLGTPLILLDSVSYLEDGTPMEYFHAVHRGDRSQFEVELVRVRGQGSVTDENIANQLA